MAAPNSSFIRLTPFGVGQSLIDIENVSLDNYTCEPVMAGDQMAVEGVRYTISGTGLIPAGTWAAIQTALEKKNGRLQSAVMAVNASELVSLNSGESSIGGPFCKLTGTQVVGTGLVMVRFELNDVSTMCDTPVVSHHWTQKFNIDARGRMTRTINGVLTTVRNATASAYDRPNLGSTAWDDTRPWADLFRRCVCPDVPGPGWRRTQQEFAYDATSRQLLYQLVDEQFAHDLPDGVRVGDMDFTYERSAENAGVGVCRCMVELEGDMALIGNAACSPGQTGNQKLIQAAIALSKMRINANFQSTIITRMAVTERNMLSGLSIRLELEAQVFPSNTNAATVMAPIAFFVGQGFKVTRNTMPRTMDPYGSFATPNGSGVTARNYAMVPHWFENIVNGMDCDAESREMPYATIYTMTGSNAFGEISVAYCPALGTDIVNGNAAANDELDNGKNANVVANKPDEGGFTQIVSYDVALTRVGVETGMVKVPTMYRDGIDFVFQIHKPRVVVTERIEVSRANTAPSRILRPKPPSSIVLSEEWNVAFGKFDMQGNRLYTGIYERKVELFIQSFDAGGGGDPPAPANADYNGFYIIPYNGSTNPTGDIVAWKAMNGYVLPTLSNLGTNAGQGSTSHVFAADNAAKPTPEERYPVTPEGYING